MNDDDKGVEKRTARHRYDRRLSYHNREALLYVTQPEGGGGEQARRKAVSR